MKKLISLTILNVFLAAGLYAQDITASLGEAKSAYSSGKLDDARFALEQTLQQIDQEVGKEILKILPTDFAGMNYHENEDNVTGTNLGFAGLFVDRSFSAEGKNANIAIIGDSPLMASVNAILAMPGILTGSNQNQKRIKIDGYKSLLEKESNEDGTESYTIQIPANATLITLDCKGVTENEAINMANQIPVTEIVKLAQ